MDSQLYFTFLVAPGSSDATNVFSGHANTLAETASSRVMYTLSSSTTEFNICSWTRRQPVSIVSGTVTGASKAIVIMRGYGRTAIARKSGYWRASWSFVDFAGDEYKWGVTLTGSAWRLLDSEQHRVAEFACKSSKHHPIVGHLSIQRQVPEQLLSLILLTCQMVYLRANGH